MDWTAAKITLKVADPLSWSSCSLAWDFYPSDLAQNRWLDYYASQFDTVETTPSIAHGLCDTHGHQLF